MSAARCAVCHHCHQDCYGHHQHGVCACVCVANGTHSEPCLSSTTNLVSELMPGAGGDFVAAIHEHPRQHQPKPPQHSALGVQRHQLCLHNYHQWQPLAGLPHRGRATAASPEEADCAFDSAAYKSCTANGNANSLVRAITYLPSSLCHDCCCEWCFCECRHSCRCLSLSGESTYHTPFWFKLLMHMLT